MTMDLKECPKCKLIYAEETYCVNDGTFLEKRKKCACGVVVSSWQKFCGRCGKKKD